MTSTQEKLGNLIHEVDPALSDRIAGTAFYMTLATVLIEDEATRFDYGLAVDNFLTAMGGEDLTGQPNPYEDERPATDDTRPLYQRISENKTVEQTVQKAVGELSIAATRLWAACSNNQYATVYEPFWEALNAFGTALGLPAEGDDMTNHPDVAANPLNSVIKTINATVKRDEQ